MIPEIAEPDQSVATNRTLEMETHFPLDNQASNVANLRRHDSF